MCLSSRRSWGPRAGFPRVVLTASNCPAFVGKIAISPGTVAVVESAADLLTSGDLGCVTA